MRYYLSNGKRDMEFNLNSWPQLLELSFHYGWIPMKPNQDSKEKWDGIYLPIDETFICAEDALNIATGLEKALPDIPDTEIEMISSSKDSNTLKIMKNGKTIKELLNELDKYWNPLRDEEVSKLLISFSGAANRMKINDFIKFCKDGKGFSIH